MRAPNRRLLPPAVALALILIATAAVLQSGAPSARAVSSDVVISQVYGAGGNTGASLTHDFIELFNRGAASVSLAGWSVQYASATGTGNFGATDTQLTELPAVTLAPGQYFLIQEVSSGMVGAALPAPDLADATPINLSGSAGKVALVRTPASLGCNGGSTPCTAAQLAFIVDLVGYGAANFFEGAGPAPAPSATTAVLRSAGGCQDTDANSADFTAASPAPRNSTTVAPCGTASPTPTPNASPTPTGTPAGTPTATPTPTAGAVRIHDIQGAAHLSPRTGQVVTNVPGIVTATRTNGFYLQDPSPDADPATSEAIFVFTGSATGVAVGDALLVSGTVAEFRPGCTPTCDPAASAYDNLTITQIGAPALAVARLSTGNALPPPVIIGIGGRVPPAQVIEDDVAGNVETSGLFDPATDGIDFYESLESMRVQVNNAVAVSRRSDFGSTAEIAVLADNGVGAQLRTTRGGIVIRAEDFNPERIILRAATASLPAVNVGDRFGGSIIGIVDYTFANTKLAVEEPLPPLIPGGLLRESTATPAADEIAVATFNVENLDPSDGPRIAALAGMIVGNLKAPDIIGVQEVQDSNGPADTGVVDAAQSFGALIAAIQAAGGPTYQFRQIDPLDKTDGGEPGGNIRVGFLFRTDRGVRFIDRPGGSATTAVTAQAGPNLSISPGRIDPQNPAFVDSRKPLAGEFQIGSDKGPKLFVVVSHFNSKGGDDPLFGRFQPPVRSSEVQRQQQAAVVNGFVQSLLAVDANANVIVLGDLNDFQFSPALTVLKGTILTDLVETQPPSERYTYVFEGNSQALDHILVTRNLTQNAQLDHDIVHINAEFFDQASDHDPQVVRIRFAAPVATPAPTPSGKPTPLPTPTPVPTPSATPGPAPTATPAPTPSATPTGTPGPKPTPGGTPAATPAPQPTASPKPAPVLLR